MEISEKTKRIESLLIASEYSAPTDDLKAELAIWTVNTVAKRKPLSEDGRSEVLLVFLERFDDLWKDSLSLLPDKRLNFFLSKTFNIRRTVTRREIIPQTRVSWMELWKMEKDERAEIHSSSSIFPQLSLLESCILFCMFDLPLSPKLTFFFQSNLKDRGKSISDWESNALKKRESRNRSLLKIENLILFYSRLLVESTGNRDRDFYKTKRLHWMDRHKRLRKKPIFSQREIAKGTGWGRKVVSDAFKRAVRTLEGRTMQLLHSA